MPETSEVGWVIGQGRYPVKRKLGEGGMAYALLALDKTSGADVVLKVPKPAMMADPQFAHRFRREIRSMQELTHDHIVKIKDVGEHEGMPFYVMDLLAGGSLQDRFELAADGKQKPMPPDSLADWLEPVARALDFIHQRFVHRDIKPANILFDAYGSAFVSDFGIVKAIADGSNEAKQTLMTQTGIVIGTGPYMAPEVSDGKFDGRVDQYALAVTVYEALSGRVPFDGKTFLEIIKKKLLGTIRPLHELVPTLPTSLTQVIEKGLSLEPNDRFGTCTAFAKAVLAKTATTPAATRAAKVTAGLKAVCPACRKSFSLPPDPAGKRVICPTCGAGFTVSKKSSEKKLAEPGPSAVLEMLEGNTPGQSENRRSFFRRPRRLGLVVFGSVILLCLTCSAPRMLDSLIFSIKAPSARIYVGIEINSTTVSGHAIKFFPDRDGGFNYEFLSDEKMQVTTNLGRLGPDGNFDADSFERTAMAVATFSKALQKEHRVSPHDTVIVASSGVFNPLDPAKAANTQDKLRKRVLADTTQTLEILDLEHELETQIKSLIPEKAMDRALLIHVGNTTCYGGAYDVERRRFTFFDLKIGVNRLLKMAQEDAAIRGYKKSKKAADLKLLADAVAMLVDIHFRQRLLKETEKTTVINGRKRIELIGGAPWVTATFKNPSGRGNKHTRLTSQDIDDFHQDVRRAWGYPPFNMPSGLDDSLTKALRTDVDGMEQRISVEDLIVGTELLKVLSDELTFQHRDVYFNNNGNKALVLGLMARE